MGFFDECQNTKENKRQTNESNAIRFRWDSTAVRHRKHRKARRRERKWVTAENLTIVKTVTEIATDLEANLKGLDVPTEKERGTHTDQEESEEAIKHAQKHAKELQMERTDKNYIFEKLRLRGAWIYKQRCFSLIKIYK